MEASIIKMLTADKMIPAMARPRPSWVCGFSLICKRAMMEKVSPRRLNGTPLQHQHSVSDKMPQISPVVAKPFVFRAWAGGAMVCGAMAGGTAPAKRVANSGSRPAKVQSFAPSAKTGVRLSTRFWAIHCRNCSPVTGPYSFPVSYTHLSFPRQCSMPRKPSEPRVRPTTVATCSRVSA